MAIFSKSKKVKEPQYVNSLLNTEVLNYKVYVMSIKEKLMYMAIAAVIGGMLGLLFYGGLFKDGSQPTDATYISNTVVFVIFAIIAIKFFMPIRTKRLQEKRIRELRMQFRSLLESLAASLSSGQNVPTALVNAKADLEVQYSENAYMVQEITEIVNGISNNVAVEKMFKNLGERSGDVDILSFGEVFEVCYSKGGNIKDVVNRTNEVISSKVSINEEIQTKLASNKVQQKAMNIIPIFIVAFLKYSNDTFAASFSTFAGVAALTVGLLIFAIAFKWGNKITDIKG